MIRRATCRLFYYFTLFYFNYFFADVYFRMKKKKIHDAKKTPETIAVRLIFKALALGEGKENAGAAEIGSATLQQRSAARRKTDLMPTVPSSSSREAPPSSSASRNSSVCSSRRSPGRAFSMTRLDQLSQPRKPKANATEPKGLSETNADMSKSMTHLAPGEKTLKRCATSKSMVHLGPPRMTRAERLRKLAREGASASSAPTSAKQQATSPSGKRTDIYDGFFVIDAILRFLCWRLLSPFH